MDKDKVQAVLDWPSPVNIKQFRGFLGLTGYYKKFIKPYALITTPLTNFLKKDKFLWGVDADEAFNKLKNVITQAPVLAYHTFRSLLPWKHMHRE